MSNELAIAAVTLSLRARVLNAVGMQSVSTLPLDKADDGADHVNVFLYRTSVNAAWRNADMNGLASPTAPGLPPLALVLHYLVSVHATDDQQAHVLLGQATTVLHDPSVLTPDEIRAATSADLPESNLHRQIDRVKLTPEALTTEEMSRLWAAFQTPYRLAAAYEASVVLLESKRQLPIGLPILTRGQDDRGPVAVSSADPPFPVLDGVRYATAGQPSATAGETVTLVGSRFSVGQFRVHLRNARTQAVVAADLPAGTGTPNEVPFSIPGTLPAGVYFVDLAELNSGPPKTEGVSTSPAMLGVSSEIQRAVATHTSVDITLATPVLPDQEVTLFVGTRPVAAPSRLAATTTLSFRITGLAPATAYWLRLRVDGVDSHLVDWQQQSYRQSQKVVTPA